MPDKLLDLKNDLVFQELFGKQKNKDITSHFLSLILGRQIQNIDLDVNKRMLGNRPDAKTGILDIRAKFNDGEDCNIELQIKPFPFMEERMLDYWSDMYSNKLNKGQTYNSLKPSISILITNYKLPKLKSISKYHTTWTLREEKRNDLILSKNIELHILEIPKIKKDEIPKDELVQWLRFIEDSENKEVQKLMSDNKYYRQAREELAYLSGDPAFQHLLDSRARFLKDMDILNYEARKEEKIELAKKLKQKNMSIDEIIELTGLTKEAVEKL